MLFCYFNWRYQDSKVVGKSKIYMQSDFGSFETESTFDFLSLENFSPFSGAIL